MITAAMEHAPTRRTRRLLLRAPLPSDIEPLFAIQGNAEAMRFTYCAADRADTAAWVEAHAARFMEDGYAPWTLVLADSNRVIGWGGLTRDPEEPHWGPEIAYFLDPEQWGRGLASELVRAALDYAFADVGLPGVDAFTRPANHASARVLVKAGFTRVGYVAELGRDRYRLAREPESKPGSV